MKKIKLDKISSIVKNLNLGNEVEFSDKINSASGMVLIAEVIDHANTFNEFEFQNGRLGSVYKGDIIPVVLGKRRAISYYSSDIPKVIKVGDVLTMTTPAGVAGKLVGINKAKFGNPPPDLKILGALMLNGKQVNIMDYSIQHKKFLEKSAPIITVLGSSMEAGKTTVMKQIGQISKKLGIHPVAIKACGAAYLQDSFRAYDSGFIDYKLFIDAGMPTTCEPAEKVIGGTLGLLFEANKLNPDLIVVECGAGIQDEYGVYELISNKKFNKFVKANIVACLDFVSVWGCKEILDKINYPIDIITGPVMNNATSWEYIKSKFDLEGESNLNGMPKLEKLILNIIS